MLQHSWNTRFCLKSTFLYFTRKALHSENEIQTGCYWRSHEIWKYKAAFLLYSAKVGGFCSLLFKYIHYQRCSALEKLRQLLVLLCKEFEILGKVFMNSDAEMCRVSFKTPDPSIQSWHLSRKETSLSTHLHIAYTMREPFISSTPVARGRI